MTPVRFSADLIAGRLAAIRQRISACSPDPAAVTVVAVTKGFSEDAVRAALAADILDIGENYADELLVKATATEGPEPIPRWHFLGSIQRNKVPRLAPVVACWQGVSRVEEGRAIARRRPGATVLVQVDIAGLPEGSRPGFHLVATMADRLDLPVRSMGMTNDLEVAVAEGSTMVRVGRGLFGARPPKG